MFEEDNSYYICNPVTKQSHGVLTECNRELYYILPSMQENNECLIEGYGGMNMKLKYSMSFSLGDRKFYRLQALPSFSDEMFLVLVDRKLAIHYVKEKEALFVDLQGIEVFGKFVPYVNSLTPVRHHFLFSEMHFSNLNVSTVGSNSSYTAQANAY